MQTLKAIMSKGPDDFGAWFENLEDVYGAGVTVADAKKNLMNGLALYVKHNQDPPAWVKIRFTRSFINSMQKVS